jgi:rfaE bifunctional protein nucleotidyltransferase chain/domain/rfaE bifunctional protein kinase chain/domain
VKPVVVVGDALLDRDVRGHPQRLAPDAPVPVIDDPVEVARPGGAALAAALVARAGCPTILVTAVGRDDAGRQLAQLVEEAGVELCLLPADGPTAEKVRILAGDHPVARLDRGGDGGHVGALTRAGRDAVASSAAVLVADYGRGVAAETGVREALVARGRTPAVWDPHPRGPSPVAGLQLVTPNEGEALRFGAAAALPAASAASGARHDLAVLTATARQLCLRWSAGAVAITMGGHGALLVNGDGPPLVAPVAPARGDVCGAGDQFSAAAAAALAGGALVSEAVESAVQAASSFVAAGGASSYRSSPRGGAPPGLDACDVAAAVRANGGTVVATGGCFDLVHAGHVSFLRAARSLGDCLIVCLNSDASVRRVKGVSRPIVGQHDRRSVLLGLNSVDAVAIFDEDTPEQVLDRLRPHIFAKGGDYAATDLPEGRLLNQWGGQAVVLPYLEGRSTTRLLQEVTTRAAS